MFDIVGVDNYNKCEQEIVPNIDISLKNNLFPLEYFSYTVGDCLFDSLQVLLHFHYTSNELQNGLVDYFMLLLSKGDFDALQALVHELHPEILYEIHNLYDT